MQSAPVNLSNADYTDKFLDNYHEHFLVLGYVRQSANACTLHIPLEIKYVIDTFVRDTDQWNEQYLDSNRLYVRGNRLKAMESSDEYGVAFGTHLVTKGGGYTWTVMICKHKDNSVDIKDKTHRRHRQTMLGVAMEPDSNTSAQQLLSSHHYLLNCCNGKLNPGDRRYAAAPTTPVIHAGDIVQIKLNLELAEHGVRDRNSKLPSLSFNVNNKNLGVAFNGISSKHKYTLVAMMGDDTEIQLL